MKSYVNMSNQKHIPRLFVILWYCGPCPSGLAYRVMNRKQTLGKPDQRDLNENLAATHGLAHMIQECRKLFRVSTCPGPRSHFYKLFCCSRAWLHIGVHFLGLFIFLFLTQVALCLHPSPLLYKHNVPSVWDTKCKCTFI